LISYLDWLDIGSNKKAIQEADKVLKKQPDFLCAKVQTFNASIGAYQINFIFSITQVLRALGLLRLGKSDECESILESVRTEVPVDEPTLQAMTIAYREMHQSIFNLNFF
jgi:N-terminal acetyltransferase B complex non-catalytic subunit